MESFTPLVLLLMVWALPISLATTFGIVVYFLFLWVIRCFSSPGSLHYAMYLRNDTITLLLVSSLIRISTDQCLFATPRSFSQLVTSFFGAMYQGILLYALCSLILLVAFLQSVEFTFLLSKTIFTRLIRDSFPLRFLSY